MSKPSFVYVTYIATTPEKVWQALTDPSIVRQYWGRLMGERRSYENVSDWKRGSPWQQRVVDSARVELVGNVLESTPPRRLVLTWAWPKDADDPEKTSRVTFEIERQGEKLVKLTVLHEDLDPEMHRGIAGGWPQVLSSLKTLLETGQPLPRP
jgi:uncharacterized protein YndB with AHSA1/START domain